MRKLTLLFMLGLLAGVVSAQTTGAPLNLNVPPTGTPSWGTLLNTNFTTINTWANGVPITASAINAKLLTLTNCNTAGFVYSPQAAACIAGGSGSGPTTKVNNVNLSDQTILNFITSTANATGLTVTPSNPSGGQVKMEITGGINMVNGGTGATAATTSDQVPVSANTTTSTWTALASCSSANQGLTYNTSTHAFGCNTISGTGITFQTNTSNNTSQVLFNLLNSTVNTTGLTLTASNPSGGQVKYEVGGTLALASLPGGAPGAADSLWTSTSTSAAAWKALSSCSTASSALTYNTSTHAFGCNSISGGAGTPGGSNTQLQYNNSGSFGGDTATTDGAGNLTVTSITGSDGTKNGVFYANRATSSDVLPSNPLTNNVAYTVNGGKPCVLYPSGTCIVVPSVAGFSCQPGLTGGGTAIAAGTISGQIGCQNDSGQTVTITAIKCIVDAGSASTANVTNSAGTALLTGAITCGTTYTNGTLSGTTTIAPGDYFKLTYVLDGTATQIVVDIRGTYPWS